ncbi:MAG: helix-turn-helix domain-containing protein [Candidatus Aenigmarchaeota archaeon]|nr:helix-turn-helix domain-containing protein [Candidatus Aenigmarchaeota archaeon]
MTSLNEKENKPTSIIAKNIASDIVLSKTPGKVIQKWREIFKISQKDFAKYIGVVPSVISDYETGRRPSPGINMVRKIVNAFVDIDKKTGALISGEFATITDSEKLNDAILDIAELKNPIKTDDFCKIINGKIIVNNNNEKIFGYTVIDSIKAIVNLSPKELAELYGMTTQRALIFINVETGRSPLVALKVTELKPGVVVLHGVDKLDPLAKRIAEVEGITLILSNAKNVDDLLLDLRKIKD